jgi:hypothetical protein
MFFKIWFYVCKFGIACLLLAGICQTAALWFPAAAVASRVFTWIIVSIALSGAILAVLILVGRMRLRCP